MIRLIKNNIKFLLGFVLGTIVTGFSTYALTLSFASGDVEHTKSDGTKTNVKAAINDLYSKATAGDATSDQLLSGKKALSKGTLLTGTMTNYSSSTAQSCTTANTSNKLYVKPANAGYYTANSSFNTNINYNPNKTVAASTSTATATANGNTTATTINLDKDRKVTIPAGYYSSATTVQNVAKGGSSVTLTLTATSYGGGSAQDTWSTTITLNKNGTASVGNAVGQSFGHNGAYATVSISNIEKKTIIYSFFYFGNNITGDYMKIRLGYVALPVTLDITASKTITLTNYKKLGKKRGEEKREKIFLENLENLLVILKYNQKNNIHFYRLTSHLVPLLTYKDSYNNILTKHKDKLREIANYIKNNNMRVDIHPDQFNVLNSNNPSVVEATISNLNYYNDLMNKLGLNTNIILHVGSSFGGKKESMNRFIENFNKLNLSIKRKIAIENDDKVFNIRNVLSLAKTINVPVVLDYHHFLVNRNNEKIEDFILDIFSTWKTTPKIHFSSPKSKKEKRSHHDYIDSDTFIDFIERIKFCDISFDVMIEAKKKDEALFRLVRELKLKTNYKFIDETTFIV